MGGMLSATTLTAVLSHCSSKKSQDITNGLQFFKQDQFATLMQVVERIIPTTDSPGAIEAKVPEFIDLMLAECYNSDQQQLFNNGFKSFIDLLNQQENADSKEVIQQQLENFEKEMKWNDKENDASFFIRTVKELTLLGYFTSKEGASEALRYIPVPGRFDACIPLDDEPAWAS